MDIVYYNRNNEIVCCFNGEIYHTRPFVNDTICFNEKLFKVLSVTIDYDTNNILALVEYTNKR
jgi:asparagine synthetase B (glutamine-hydrolysing)